MPAPAAHPRRRRSPLAAGKGHSLKPLALANSPDDVQRPHIKACGPHLHPRPPAPAYPPAPPPPRTPPRRYWWTTPYGSKERSKVVFEVLQGPLIGKAVAIVNPAGARGAGGGPE
jgi:hypothetical protein